MYQFTYAGLFSLFFWLLVVSFQIECKKRIKKDLKELKKKNKQKQPDQFSEHHTLSRCHGARLFKCLCFTT